MDDQLDLSDFFQTKDQANEFATRLSTLSEKIYNTNFNLEKDLMAQFGIKKKDAFMKLFRKNDIDIKSHSALKTFLTMIAERVVSLPLLSLIIAFEPKEQTLKSLSQWCLLNIKKQAVFDITIDRNLIAGATISFKGRSMDFSIKPQLDQTIIDIMTPKVEKPTEEKAVAKHISADNLSLGR